MDKKMYEKYYSKFDVLKNNFETILEAMESEQNKKNKLDLALYALDYAVYSNCGYFTSSRLEKYFIDCAKEIKVDLDNIEYKKGSFLHVLTRGYAVGGHTRVVERWIKNAPDNQIQSVVVLDTNKNELRAIQDNVCEKNGEYIVFEKNLSIFEKAQKLRKLASGYEYVILHIHMDDPIAILAFGIEDFKRPVLLYNHASHLFWLGKSIADVVLDIESNDEVTKIKRNISNTYFLGVPSGEIKLSESEKNESRKKLKLPLDKKIVVLSGSAARFVKIGKDDYKNVIKQILDEDTLCYMIGIGANNKEFKSSNIIPLDRVGFSDGYLDYIKSADLYLDSYPFCGGTAMIDAISVGVPALSLKSAYPQFDYLTSTSAYCYNEDDFIQKAKRILNDECYAKEILSQVRTSLIENQSIVAWNNKIKKLFEIAPIVHKVKDLSNEIDYCEPNDLSVLCNALVNNKFLENKPVEIITNKDIEQYLKYGSLQKRFGIPYLFEILTYKKGEKRYREIKLFSISISSL